MAIKWSPGCRCCGGCDVTEIGYTPTTEQMREDYPQWQSATEYLAGDLFVHSSINEQGLFLFEAPMTMQSGPGWTAFEESRYTNLRRVDLLNEVDEWHLYGDGWLELSPEELDDYLRFGRIAQEMGFITKRDVLPSVTNWAVTWNFNPVLAQQKAPMELDYLAGVTLDSDLNITHGFYSKYRYVEEDSADGLPDSEYWDIQVKMHHVMGIIVDGTGTDYDTHYSLSPNLNPKTMSRYPQPQEGAYKGTLQADSNLADLVGTEPAATVDGYTYLITDGPGNIWETADRLDGIAVETGDFIKCTDWTDPGNKNSWTVYRDAPGYSTITTVDVLTGSITKEDPDQAGAITGGKVGIYCAKSGPPDEGDTVYQSPIMNGLFTNGLTRTERRLSLLTPDCAFVPGNMQCPCPDRTEYSSDIVFPGGVSLIAAQNMRYVAVNGSNMMDMQQPPNESTTREIAGSEPRGTSIRKVDGCRWEGVNFYLMLVHETEQVAGSQNRFDYWTHISVVYERFDMSIGLTESRKVRLFGRSKVETAGIYLADQGRVTTGGSPPSPQISLSDYNDAYFLDAYWINGSFCGIGCSPRVLTQTESLEMGVDESLALWNGFNCSGWTLQGTYRHSQYESDFPGETDPFKNGTWTIASA